MNVFSLVSVPCKIISECLLKNVWYQCKNKISRRRKSEIRDYKINVYDDLVKFNDAFHQTMHFYDAFNKNKSRYLFRIK